MNKKNNATCSICGTPYYMCLSCKDMMNLNPWKRHTDTSEHYKIYQILRGFNIGIYTKEEAKSKLENVDLSDFDSFRENVKGNINRIMKDDLKNDDITYFEDVVVNEPVVETKHSNRKKITKNIEKS